MQIYTMCPYTITSFFLTLSHEDGQTVYLEQKDTVLGELHTLSWCHPPHKMAFGKCCANRIKSLRAEHGECEKLKISAPTDYFGIGFCEAVNLFFLCL